MHYIRLWRIIYICTTVVFGRTLNSYRSSDDQSLVKRAMLDEK